MFSLPKNMLIILISAVGLHAPAAFEFETLNIENFDFIEQSQNECVPTSFLYLMKLGNPELSRAYDSIPGASDQEKLESIIDVGLTHRSTISNTPLFERSSGTKRASFQQWIDILLKSKDVSEPVYQTQMIHRLETESSPGVFVRRIHSLIIDSLRQQVPVMVGVELSKTDHEIRDFIYELSHALVIVGVQKELSNSETGFAIWYLDPEYGEIFAGFIYEELNQPFNAQIFETPESADSTWSDGSLGVIKPGGRYVSSPYLRLEAPSVGQDMTLGWDQTRNLFIDTIMAATSQ